jgi:uracil-DNA glycosylase
MEQLFGELILNGWLNKDEAETFMRDKNLSRAINESTSPVYSNIFNALKLVSYDSVKVLILGQDPYPNPLHAHGLAFSSKNLTTPGSLRNIFKAIDSVYGSELVQKKNNDLTSWAESGVLLLNTALTYKNTYNSALSDKENKNMQVREKKFHIKTWENFVDLIVTKLLLRNKKLVMLLWGGEAWNIVYKNINHNNIKMIMEENGKVYLPDNNVLILHTDHPSQVKINLGGKFLEQAPLHFRECDEFLEEDKVVWTNL